MPKLSTFSYHKVLKNGIEICSTQAAHAQQLDALQIKVFPTLADHERFKAKHYLRHIEHFAEGQFVAMDGDRVVGMTTTIRYDFDFRDSTHTFAEMIAGGWLDTHQPAGIWLYGLDIGVDPEYRRKGIAKALYQARQDTVERLCLAGQITVGMPAGYGAVKTKVSAQQYYHELVAGKRNDPTLSAQFKVGFQPRKLIANYLEDPACDNYGILIVKPNPLYPKQKTTMSYIQLNTPLPGPKSQAMLARRAAALPSGLAKSTEIAVASAKGALVYDVDGNTLLDFAGGIGMLNAGHCPPQVQARLQQQSQALIHSCALVTTFEPYLELAEKLNRLTPGDFPKKTLLANSGAEAVENAVKIAKAYTGRQAVICFEGAYHGRSLLTMSLTSKYNLFKKSFGPFVPEVYRLPAPNLYRRPVQMDEESYIQFCMDRFDNAFIAQVGADAVAAVLIEPIQGEAGFVPMPKKFLHHLRKRCDEFGIVLIADEIQSGFGRTGKFFACDHYELIPDILTMAKSLGSGMPISAVTGKAEIMDAPHPGGVGGTFGGSPMAASAAIATVEIMEDPAFMAHAQALGQRMAEIMQGWYQRYPRIGDVRGIGAMRLVEFVKDRDSKTPDPELTLSVIKAAVAQGLILIRAGLYSNGIRLLPPLVMQMDQLEEGMNVLESAIKAYTGVRV